MKNCWNIKKECPFEGTDASHASCQAYAVQTSCWDFNWFGFYSAMPDGPGKDEWKDMMVKWCSSCKVRDSHKQEVDSFLAKLVKI